MRLRVVCASVGVLALLATPSIAQAAAPPGAPPKQPKSGHQLFMQSAQESRGFDQVRLPMYRGQDAAGGTVWFVITDASSRAWADRYGVNYSPKLANVVGTGAAMSVTWGTSGPTFPFTPTFGLPRSITPGTPGSTCPAGERGTRVQDNIPVACFTLGADGSNGQSLGGANGSNSYSPLIQIQTDDGPVVLNAPQIANSTGQGGKVIRLEKDTDSDHGHVVYVETAGLYQGRTVHYVSFDSSIPILSALENVTFAPAMNRSPSTPGSPGTPGNATVAGTSRSGLIAVTNGQTGLGNPERQGINSAIFDGASAPPNVIQFTPDDIDAGAGETLYSPLWDIHLAKWLDGVTPTRQTDFEDVFANSDITAADGLAMHPVTFWIVNCPLVSTDAAGVYVIPPPT